MGYRSNKNPPNKAPIRTVAGRGNDPRFSVKGLPAPLKEDNKDGPGPPPKPLNPKALRFQPQVPTPKPVNSTRNLVMWG